MTSIIQKIKCLIRKNMCLVGKIICLIGKIISIIKFRKSERPNLPAVFASKGRLFHHNISLQKP